MIESVSSFKMLGVWHQNNLKWNTQSYRENRQKGYQKVVLSQGVPYRINLPTEVGVICYQTKIRPLLNQTDLGRDPTISRGRIRDHSNQESTNTWPSIPTDSLSSLLYIIQLQFYISLNSPCGDWEIKFVCMHVKSCEHEHCPNVISHIPTSKYT